MKANSLMLVTVLGIVVFLLPNINELEAVFIIASHPFLLSYTVLLASTEIDTRLEHSRKAGVLMLDTPLPNTIDLIREAHSLHGGVFVW